MKIAVWNIKHKSLIKDITEACERIKADIFILLTEMDEQVQLPYSFCFKTPDVTEIKPEYYKPIKNRVAIYTNYECVEHYLTYHDALCVELKTEMGNLLVYGTIIGTKENRLYSFRKNLQRQIEDSKRFASEEKNICICGSYNMGFSDNCYRTKFRRNSLVRSFTKNHIRLLTGDEPEWIDYLAITEAFVKNADIKIEEWNVQKTLSDHKGITAEILPR